MREAGSTGDIAMHRMHRLQHTHALLADVVDVSINNSVTTCRRKRRGHQRAQARAHSTALTDRSRRCITRAVRASGPSICKPAPRAAHSERASCPATALLHAPLLRRSCGSPYTGAEARALAAQPTSARQWIALVAIEPQRCARCACTLPESRVLLKAMPP